MQQVQTIDSTLLASARIVPFMSTPLCRYEGEACSIEKEALSLQADLGSGSLGKTKGILKQLKQLSGMAGRLGNTSSKVQGTIGGAIAKAQRRIDELEMQEQTHDTSDDAHAKFEMTVYGAMSQRAQKFYDSIDANAHYTIAPVNHKGHIVHDAAKKIDGHSLKRVVTLIKFHSLETEHKKQILHSTFGADAAKGEGTPKDKELLLQKKTELLQLHEALDNIEAYKAFIISHKFKPGTAAPMLAKNHAAVVAAHAQINEVAKKYDRLIENIDDGMAMAILRVAKLKMKKLLKENVIECVMLDQPLDGPVISGGVNTLEAIPGFGGYSDQPFIMPPLLSC